MGDQEGSTHLRAMISWGLIRMKKEHQPICTILIDARFLFFVFTANTHALQKGVMALSEKLHFELNGWHIFTFATHYWCIGADREFSKW